MCLVANTRRGNLIYIDTTASAAEDRINQKVAYVILTATAASASLILEETSGSGDVVRFDKAAAGTEVSDIYNSGAPLDLTTLSSNTNLQSWWRMGDGDTYPTITDNKGSVNGTMTNMESGDIVSDVPGG